MRENELEDAGAAALSRVLPHLPALRELDVTANQLTRPGAVLVVKGITAPTGGSSRAGFELLGLDENGISEEGVGQIKELLKVRGEGMGWEKGTGAGSRKEDCGRR